MSLPSLLPNKIVFRVLIFSPLPLMVLFYLTVVPFFMLTVDDREDAIGKVAEAIMFSAIGLIFILLPLYLLVTSALFVITKRDIVFGVLGLVFNVVWFGMFGYVIWLGASV